jgi:hypothetical protein
MASGEDDAARSKAIRAVEAMFERYRILTDQRPKGHIVSHVDKNKVQLEVDCLRTSIER